MVKRRVSYFYSDFVMGRYDRNDEGRLVTLFDNMSAEEKMFISCLNFEQMWFRIWFNIPDHQSRNRVEQEHYARYIRCREYFERNFMQDKGRFLRELINRSRTSETSWEIPKGRKSSANERDINCAIREVYEETGLNPEEYILLDEAPMITSYIHGKTKYVNSYYIGLLKNPNCRHLRVDYSNEQQTAEVIDIRWIPLKELEVLDINQRLRVMMWNLSKILRKKYKIQRIATLELIR